MAGSETTPLDNDQGLRKWKVKAGKAMFAIKTSIEEEMEEQSGKDQSKVIEEIQFFEDKGELESS